MMDNNKLNRELNVGDHINWFTWMIHSLLSRLEQKVN